MAQVNSTPGMPPNFQANLPVASTMTVNVPSRSPYTDSRTGIINNHQLARGGF